MKKGLLGIIVLLVVTLPLSSRLLQKHYTLSRFIHPRLCSGCHYKIYKQWKSSTHALAHKDELYNLVRIHDMAGLTRQDEIYESETCVKCHTPVGYAAGFPVKSSDDLSKTPGIATFGVQCDFCHSATGAEKLYNGYFYLKPGHGRKNFGVKRGPFIMLLQRNTGANTQHFTPVHGSVEHATV